MALPSRCSVCAAMAAQHQANPRRRADAAKRSAWTHPDGGVIFQSLDAAELKVCTGSSDLHKRDRCHCYALNNTEAVGQDSLLRYKVVLYCGVK